jgi:hypothetical protein
MSVRGVGGKRGGVGGASGPKAASGAAQVKGPAPAGRVERNAGLEQVSAGATSNTGTVSPIVREAILIAKELQEGRIGDKAQATGRLVATILKEKLGKNFTKSKKVKQAIADTITEDPHLGRVLERIWSHREG